MQIAALILGILGLLLLGLPFLGITWFGFWIPLILSCFALVFGHIGKARQAGAPGLALAGFVLGIVGILAWIALWILVLIGLAFIATVTQPAPSTYEDPAAAESGTVEVGDEEADTESKEKEAAETDEQ